MHLPGACRSGCPPISTWSELARRTWRESFDDGLLDLAAQLAYYFFLALFPALLFGLALASFFPLSQLTDDLGRVLGPVVSPDVLQIVQEQMRRLAHADSGGLLTLGAAGALWSSSAALVSISEALNRAYDIEEGRPWWKVRLTAIGLTIGLALVILAAMSLVLAGPTMADALGRRTGYGPALEWTWLILQWPLTVLLVAGAIGVVYYFGPDAEQKFGWVMPGRAPRRDRVARREPALQALRRQVRRLPGHLWRRGRRRGAPALALRLEHRGADWRRAQRRDRACLAAGQGSRREDTGPAGSGHGT